MLSILAARGKKNSSTIGRCDVRLGHQYAGLFVYFMFLISGSMSIEDIFQM